ncbi:MAG: hypothetical protein ACXABY_01860 [Candidatus Thorarchaeota archaeon]|jgi:hypothetical protein
MTQHNKNKAIPTIRLVTCPACKKDRLGKYENADGSVDAASEETVETRGEKRYLEVCDFCVKKYRKVDEGFVTDNMRKLAKAFQDDKSEDGQSDHKDFSLN